MLKLDGVVSVSRMCDINDYTNLRFKDASKLETPEALTLFEQKFLEKEEIKALCEKAYGYPLYEPKSSYIPDNIINAFYGSNLVPVTYMPMQCKILALYIPELKRSSVVVPNHEVEELPTTIYNFIEIYQRYYGTHKILQEIPPKTLLDLVVKEAIELEAADITISTVGKSAQVYYNVRKRKVHSSRIFSYEGMVDIITYLCIRSPYDSYSRHPKYVGVDLNKDYRGRVVINAKFKGYSITMRLLPNKAFDSTFEQLRLSPATVRWIREEMFDMQTGLRLLVGPTMSGKNTTALAGLREVAMDDRYKIISVEMPVEQELPGVEQINCEGIEDYHSNIKSLIHQNPDFVYITEMRDETGLPTMHITNTGKRVLSTLHSNGVADTISRLINITGSSTDIIIQTLHSVCYQELVRDDEKDIVTPKNRYVRFTDEFKYELYGKSAGEIIKIIKDREGGDAWISA